LSTNAKPVARAPTTPAAPSPAPAPDTEATAESLGWQLRSALPPMRLHSISIYNNEADVLWLSEGALGPDEHNVVVEAIDYLQNEKGTLYHELGMEDGRIAIFLGLRGPRMELVGTVMILADMKSLSEGTMERILTVPVKTLMQRMAVFLRKQYPQSTSDTSSIAVLPGADVKPVAEIKPIADVKPLPEAKLAPVPAPGGKNSSAPSEPLAPKQVEALLTLELVPDPAPPAPPPAAAKGADKSKAVPPAATPAAAAKPAVKAVPKKLQPVQAGATPGAAGKAVPAAGTAKGQNTPAVEAQPPREIEILPFDDDISITQARRALPQASAAPVAGIEVLSFDDAIEIPKAQPEGAAAEPVAEIEVLDFDAELTMPPTRVSVTQPAPAPAPPVAKTAPAVEPPVARAAPVVEPPVAKAAARVESLAPKTAPLVDPAVAAKATPAQFETFSGKAPAAEPPAAKAATTGFEPFAPKAAPAAPNAKSGTAAASSTALPAASGAASAAASPKSTAATATVAVPVMNTGSTTSSKRVRDAAEEVLLIQDTGPVKKLELPSETSVEPALPAAPPPPPLTAAETATDLTLYVQELIKLRSSGRTRRYEVLARSQRDADRNEVPTAFIAETAKGREGAALDALVVERLLQWLGQHGETIWDSEPASFSVNLSIGALEDEHFADKIAGWLKQYNVEAEYVGFEVSELACVQSRPAVLRFVEAVEKLGCFLVIDNFSFDSNMFELLGSKALRHVKIDPKLTGAAMKEKLPQALVVAILQACKVLGVHCVAKRIESQASLQWLTAVGCDFAQTFQLEKPRAIDTLVSGKAIKALRE
jgi:EAL domain-containing protein (putative c-di-GMP-specific phosphodiesterase class I)